MGSAANYDCTEVANLKISANQIPLSVSLRPLVLQHYADPKYPRQIGQSMDREELIGYLRAYETVHLAPLDAVLAQTEVIGDPALPSQSDCAALRWTGDAFDLWEESFPLESKLASQLRKLKPLIAISAVLDANFYSPGAHPLHQILDTLHTTAAGWQESLGRAGQPTLTLVLETIEAVLATPENGKRNFAPLADALKMSVERNRFRAERMAKRASETELGRLRTAQAKVSAAAMINETLGRYPIPAEIGKFLRGPWYESAQLVCLKFGEQSEEWRELSATTTVLLESLQPPDGKHESARQQQFESVAGIPASVKRWLLSLQHDADAVEQIMSEIEYAHLRIMRAQPTQLEHIPPIKLQETINSPVDADDGLEHIKPGQWFLIRARKGDILRAQITMKDEKHQQLLFCNQAGIKIQTLDFANFAKLLENQTARHLDTGASFSRALIAAAGIESDEALAALMGNKPKAAPAVKPDPESVAAAPKADRASPSTPELPDSGIPELPMGTWLGFHDADPPLLAKLALHDKVRRLLIFVNRKGIEQRRLDEDEYLALIQGGLIDIMEATNNFREQVERARKRMQNHKK